MFRRTLIVVSVGCAVLLCAPLAEAQQEGRPCDPEPTDMGIAHGDLITCALELPGDSDLLRFTGSPGEIIVIQTAGTSEVARPCIELIAPDNSRLSACTNAGSNRLDATLTLEGLYTISVTDRHGQVGTYNIALDRFVPVSPTARPTGYGQTLPDALNLPGDLDFFYFGATAGDVIRVTATAQTGTVTPCVELSSPTGARITACASGLTNQIDTTLAESGLHSVLVRARFASQTGGYALTLQCFVGVCVSTLPPTTVDDAYSTAPGTPLVVAPPGVLANDNSHGGGSITAQLVSGVSHGVLALVDDGSFTYTPAGGFQGVDSFTYEAVNPNGPGNVATVTLTVTALPPPVATDDAYSVLANTQLNAPAPGVLGNDDSSGGSAVTASLVAGPSHGALALNVNGSFSYVPSFNFVGADSFTYRAVNDGGLSTVATVIINVLNLPDPQPPTDLVVDTVVGQLVTVRFKAPVLGPAPIGYVLKGGLLPGQVLAALPTLSPAPIFTFPAPTGSFVIRLHTLTNAGESGPSNEVPLHVNVPVPPSAPTDLTGLVDGSFVALAWKNTFGGGAPSNIVLDVSGTLNTSLSLGLVESFVFPAVPGGGYTLQVRAVNAGGTSAPSNAVSLAFPGVCLGAPLTPENFLAYKIASTIFVLWDPPASGPAPTQYVLEVSGSFVGAFPTAGRRLSGAVGPGSYGLSVRAINPCGSSPATPEQVVTVP